MDRRFLIRRTVTTPSCISSLAMEKSTGRGVSAPPDPSHASFQPRRQVVVVIALLAALVYRFFMLLDPIATVTTPGTTYALCTEADGIYTVDLQNSKAQCLLVSDDLIVATGSESEHLCRVLGRSARW